MRLVQGESYFTQVYMHMAPGTVFSGPFNLTSFCKVLGPDCPNLRRKLRQFSNVKQHDIRKNLKMCMFMVSRLIIISTYFSMSWDCEFAR